MDWRLGRIATSVGKRDIENSDVALFSEHGGGSQLQGNGSEWLAVDRRR
jgi:hypothetical protein